MAKIKQPKFEGWSFERAVKLVSICWAAYFIATGTVNIVKSSMEVRTSYKNKVFSGCVDVCTEVGMAWADLMVKKGLTLYERDAYKVELSKHCNNKCNDVVD